MKLLRSFIAACGIGWSTHHLHTHSPKNNTTLSKHIGDYRPSKLIELTGEIDHLGTIKFKVIELLAYDRDLSVVTRPPKRKPAKRIHIPKILPTRIPQYSQSMHRRR